MWTKVFWVIQVVGVDWRKEIIIKKEMYNGIHETEKLSYKTESNCTNYILHVLIYVECLQYSNFERKVYGKSEVFEVLNSLNNQIY